MAIRRRKKPSLVLPLSSMGDIAFLLIIFFMLASNFMKTGNVELEKPDAPSLEQQEPPKCSVLLDKDGQIWFEGTQVSKGDVTSALKELAESPLPPGTYIRLNVRLGVGELSGPDWTERARQTCVAKGFRFCLINPVRAEAPERQDGRKRLTMAELRELSDDEVLQILSMRHELTDRQRELVKSLMEEVQP